MKVFTKCQVNPSNSLVSWKRWLTLPSWIPHFQCSCFVSLWGPFVSLCSCFVSLWGPLVSLWGHVVSPCSFVCLWSSFLSLCGAFVSLCCPYVPLCGPFASLQGHFVSLWGPFVVVLCLSVVVWSTFCLESLQRDTCHLTHWTPGPVPSRSVQLPVHDYRPQSHNASLA